MKSFKNMEGLLTPIILSSHSLKQVATTTIFSNLCFNQRIESYNHSKNSRRVKNIETYSILRTTVTLNPGQADIKNKKRNA